MEFFYAFSIPLVRCIGEDRFTMDHPITRVEFRLWRDALRAMDIHTIQDLQERETALADWLCDKWFRLLEKPKVRGRPGAGKKFP